ncbi:terpenoid synthase [Stereum hirsutum FP-91666 SS1]|uniref:Terpene synthase n=1 Tax=Stereum hirsutum (strain FP-91666) TaxID=721885 RepID=R7RVK9_STEHR|nr:terpenoid synthase [Stereum hirsutum FP-91666 SS1]EIM79126.1 terpenoid synthase [Stereum hirsutum FP-91666 SS1]
MSQTYTIPDTLANWPWKRKINQHYEEVKMESASWARSFHAFSPQAQDAFDRCDFKRLRTGCDLMNLFFVIDEHSDLSSVADAETQAQIIMNALMNPEKPRPHGEWVGGEVARQYWELAIKTATPKSQRRFVAAFDDYMNAVVQQAKDRTHSTIRDIDSYMEVRRKTIGAWPSFALLELDMDLPEDFMDHPVMHELHVLSISMICLGNVSDIAPLPSDIVSWNLEQSRGDDTHNIVRIVMNQLDTDINGAMAWVEMYHKELEVKFMDIFTKSQEWNKSMNKDISRYVEGLGNWVRANDQWSFESKRYFGDRGLEIMSKRTVSMMPKRNDVLNGTQLDIGPVIVDGSIL